MIPPHSQSLKSDFILSQFIFIYFINILLIYNIILVSSVEYSNLVLL